MDKDSVALEQNSTLNGFKDTMPTPAPPVHRCILAQHHWQQSYMIRISILLVTDIKQYQYQY